MGVIAGCSTITNIRRYLFDVYSISLAIAGMYNILFPIQNDQEYWTNTTSKRHDIFYNILSKHE